MSEPIVFDNEPLYAAVFDEVGAEVVAEYLLRGASWRAGGLCIYRNVDWKELISDRIDVSTKTLDEHYDARTEKEKTRTTPRAFEMG